MIGSAAGSKQFGRWMLGALGFPLGGLAALTTIGAVDTAPRALAAGALTGGILGLAQSFASASLPRLGWSVATAIGLGTGLAVGATVVDFDTSIGALAAQGAVTGLAVGAAQAFVLHRRTPIGALPAVVWAPFLAGCWALGWTVTTAVGVDVDRQFTVFGATGAVTVTALTAWLPMVLQPSTDPITRS